MTDTLTVKLVLTDGDIDETASVDAFRQALSAFRSEWDTSRATIAEAVDAVFDAHGSMNMPALMTLTLQRLNVQPENFTSLSTRVSDYLRSNSKGESSLYIITKGKSGGVRRRRDIVAK